MTHPNLTEARPSFVTHLECSISGERYQADQVHGLSAKGRPLLVRYDLAGIAARLSRQALEARPTDMWRWRELLPVRAVEDIVSLGGAIGSGARATSAGERPGDRDRQLVRP